MNTNQNIDALSESVRQQAMEAAQVILELTQQKVARAHDGKIETSENVHMYMEELRNTNPKEFKALKEFGIKNIKDFENDFKASPDADANKPFQEMDDLFKEADDHKHRSLKGEAKGALADEIKGEIAKEVFKAILKDAVGLGIPVEIVSLLSKAMDAGQGTEKEKDKGLANFFGEVEASEALGSLSPGSSFTNVKTLQGLFKKGENHGH